MCLFSQGLLQSYSARLVVWLPDPLCLLYWAETGTWENRQGQKRLSQSSGVSLDRSATLKALDFSPSGWDRPSVPEQSFHSVCTGSSLAWGSVLSEPHRSALAGTWNHSGSNTSPGASLTLWLILGEWSHFQDNCLRLSVTFPKSVLISL